MRTSDPSNQEAYAINGTSTRIGIYWIPLSIFLYEHLLANFLSLVILLSTDALYLLGQIITKYTQHATRKDRYIYQPTWNTQYKTWYTLEYFDQYRAVFCAHLGHTPGEVKLTVCNSCCMPTPASLMINSDDQRFLNLVQSTITITRRWTSC